LTLLLPVALNLCFSNKMYKKIVIKIGSGVIATGAGGELDIAVVRNIVDQIVELRRRGIGVILVTSGAVATGRGLVNPDKQQSPIVAKQVLAAVGQVKLMSIYAEMFKAHGYNCAQVLVTKEDFRDRQHYFNMRNCFESLLHDNIVPIVNENDVIAITELIFTDNDELAGLVASQLDADAVIILSTVSGIVAGDPNDPEAVVISEINLSSGSFEKYITSDISSAGRGGMHTKFNVAKKLAHEGIVTHIAGGKKPGVILAILSGKQVGTKFVAKRKVSSVKRRIAHSDSAVKGAVTVDKRAEDILVSRRTVSLLPVGVTNVVGDFKKGDTVSIIGHSKKVIGYGIVQYDASKAREAMGQKGARALIHYDYMFVQ